MCNIWTMYLQINTVKYDADREITITYGNLQIVQSQFFPDMLIFIYIQSYLKIFWFIGIRIQLVWSMVNRYLVFVDFFVNSNPHSNFKFEGKIKFIAVTYLSSSWGTIILTVATIITISYRQDRQVGLMSIFVNPMTVLTLVQMVGDEKASWPNFFAPCKGHVVTR